MSTWYHKLRLGALALALGVSLSAVQAHANGRVVSFERRVAGPYEIALGTSPTSPSVGTLHLTMRVADAATKVYIPDAEVEVTGREPGAGAIAVGPVAVPENPRDPFFYDVNISVDQEGTWLFTVAVSGTLGEASTDFPVEVRRASPVPGIATLMVLVTLLAVTGLSMRAVLRERGRRKGPKRRRRE